MKKLIAVLFAFALLQGVAMPQEDDMMPAYVLVRATDGWDPNEPLVYQTGYPVDVRGIPRLGGNQIPPRFIQVVLLDLTVAQTRVYCQPWMRVIDWEFIDHDYAIDGHRLRAFVKPEFVSASGLNSLTRELVESYLNNWGAAVVGVAANSVTFDALVFNAIASNGFWARNVSQFTFTEKSYDIDQGIHEVEFNYQGYDLNPAELASRIINNGCEVTKNVPNKITFTCERSVVFNNFKLDVKMNLDNIYSVRRWKFTQAAVQAAYDNGGSLEVTQQQAINYLRNRLLD